LQKDFQLIGSVKSDYCCSLIKWSYSAFTTTVEVELLLWPTFVSPVEHRNWTPTEHSKPRYVLPSFWMGWSKDNHQGCS